MRKSVTIDEPAYPIVICPCEEGPPRNFVSFREESRDQLSHTPIPGPVVDAPNSKPITDPKAMGRDSSTVSLCTLRDFLSPRNMTSSQPQKHTPNTLRSLYTSVKSRSQLRQLRHDDITTLLSLFGSLSFVGHGDNVQDCIYMNKFVSHMAEISPRTYWPFVLQIGRDKERSGYDLNTTDHFWMMRANIAAISTDSHEKQKGEFRPEHYSSSELTKLRPCPGAVSDATFHYLRLRHNTHPQIHIPYLESLLSLGTPEYIDRAVTMFCNLFSRLHRQNQQPPSDLVTMLWTITLKHELSVSCKERILTMVHERIAHPRALQLSYSKRPPNTSSSFKNVGSTSTLGMTHLSSALTGSIFPNFSPSSILLPHHLQKWAVSQALAAFAPDVPLDVRWRNLEFIAWTNSNLNPDPSQAFISDAAADWRLVFSLTTLEQTLSGIDKIRGEWRKLLRRGIKTLWRTLILSSKTDHRPALVARAIIISFLRLAAKMADKPLGEACYRFCATHNLWVDERANYEISTSQTKGLILEYAIASASFKGSWEEVFERLRLVLPGTRWQPQLVNSIVGHLLTREEVISAQQVCVFAERNGIRLWGQTFHALGIALASRKPAEDVLDLLDDRRLSPGQSEELLGKILVRLESHHREYVDPQLLSILGNKMRKIYLKVPPSIRFRHCLTYILPVMVASNHSSMAMSITGLVHKIAPAYLPAHFFFHFLRILLRHRQFQHATKLMEFVEKLSPTLKERFRSALSFGLAKAGASNLSRKAYRFMFGWDAKHSLQELLTRAVNFRPHSPPRLFALKVIPTLSRCPDQHSISYAMYILIQARRPLAARKVFERSYETMDVKTRTVLLNMLLHGLLIRRAQHNSRLIRHMMRTIEFFERKYGFVQDRITVNIMVKGLLRWNGGVMDTLKLQALFDYMIRMGYMTESPMIPKGWVPFGTPNSSWAQQFRLPNLPSSISFEKHIRPLYKMFITAFYVRGDVQAARIVVGMFKREEQVALQERVVRNRARALGQLKRRDRMRITRKA